MKRAALAFGIVAVVVAAVLFYATWPRGRASGNAAATIETAQAQAADFYLTLAAQGVLEAARYVPLVNRARRTQIVSVLADGAEVEEGEVVIKLNAAELKKTVDELEAKVAEAEERVRKSRADAEKRVENTRTALAKAKDSAELASLQSQAAIEQAEAEVAFLEKELEVAQGQLEKQERLLKEKLVPVTEVEAAQDELRDKRYALEAARRGLNRARMDAEATARLKKLATDTAQLELDQAEGAGIRSVASAERDLAEKSRDLDEASEQLEQTEMKAPAAGMLLLDQTWEDGWRPLRVGDRVREGERVARIIDPTQMQVRCDISEAEIEAVAAGQPALVRVPALGDDVLAAEVETIDNLARQRSPWEGGVPGKKVFAASAALTERDPRLRPGMGAVVEIVVGHVTEGIAVPLEALFLEDGDPVVYVADGDGYRTVSVEVGKRSNQLVSVGGELRAGETVACRRPPAERVIAAAAGGGQ